MFRKSVPQTIDCHYPQLLVIEKKLKDLELVLARPILQQHDAKALLCSISNMQSQINELKDICQSFESITRSIDIRMEGMKRYMRDFKHSLSRRKK